MIVCRSAGCAVPPMAWPVAGPMFSESARSASRQLHMLLMSHTAQQLMSTAAEKESSDPANAVRCLI